jgi:hypothetical protein
VHSEFPALDKRRLFLWPSNTIYFKISNYFQTNTKFVQPVHYILMSLLYVAMQRQSIVHWLDKFCVWLNNLAQYEQHKITFKYLGFGFNRLLAGVRAPNTFFFWNEYLRVLRRGIYHSKFFFSPWRSSPLWARAPLFIEASGPHSFRHSTHERTPLDDGSTRRKDLYLTTHDTYRTQISMSSARFEPAISVSERTV